MNCVFTKFDILIAVKEFGSWTFAAHNSKVFTFLCWAGELCLFLELFSGSFLVNFVFHDIVTA